MTYTIAPVNIDDDRIEQKLIELYTKAFAMPTPLSKGYLARNTQTNSVMPSVFMAAIEDGEIIGCNGFISTNFTQNGETFVAYQSCWSATHPEHQGKKVWLNIMRESQHYLKSIGGGFIFGLPNDNSRPIFLHKLGYEEHPGVMKKFINIPLLRYSGLSADSFSKSANRIDTDEDQMISLKKLMYPDLKVYNQGESLIWGVEKQVSKLGLKTSFFYVGGMRMSSSRDLKPLLQSIYSDNKIGYIQFVMADESEYKELINGWQPIRMNGFISFDLNREVKKNLNIMIGALDVY
jgi:hypothetical protein